MIDRLARRLDGAGAHLVLVALLHVDLALWSLLIEAEDRALGMNANSAVLLCTVVLAGAAVFRRAVRSWPGTWLAFLGVSVWCLQAGFPYSSNLYYLWVYIDLFIVALFFGVPDEERRPAVIAASSRLLLGAIFLTAVVQKLTTPTFVDGSFYFQSFSSGFFGMQFGPFAERFLFQSGLSDHVLASGRAVAAGLAPDLPPGAEVTIPIVQSEGLLTSARVMAWATIAVESGCGLLFLLNRAPGREAVNHAALFAFILGTYLVVPMIVDWGWAFAMLGMATASPRWKVAYAAVVVLLMGVAASLGPETVRLVNLYSELL